MCPSVTASLSPSLPPPVRPSVRSLTPSFNGNIPSTHCTTYLPTYLPTSFIRSFPLLPSSLHTYIPPTVPHSGIPPLTPTPGPFLHPSLPLCIFITPPRVLSFRPYLPQCPVGVIEPLFVRYLSDSFHLSWIGREGGKEELSKVGS